MRKLHEHISYANVMATLAVFIALGGSAYAVSQLPRNSVGAAQIKRNAVGTSELRDRSVKLGDISVPARRSLRGAKGDQGPVGPSGVTYHAAVNSGEPLSAGTRPASRTRAEAARTRSPSVAT
jgi:hypothetical protein